MAKSFNPAAPADTSVRIWEEVELGWAHTVSDDGTIEYTLDDNGQPIPVTHRIPTKVTPSMLLAASKKLPKPLADRMARGEIDQELTVELIGAVVGRDWVLERAADPTVDPSAFWDFVLWVVSEWGMVDGGGAGPFETASPASPSVS